MRVRTYAWGAVAGPGRAAPGEPADRSWAQGAAAVGSCHARASWPALGASPGPAGLWREEPAKGLPAGTWPGKGSSRSRPRCGRASQPRNGASGRAAPRVGLATLWPPSALLWISPLIQENRNFGFCFVQFSEYLLYNFFKIQKQQKTGN
jgi:hypothetical protein